ncbi:hypothetical protein JL720_55 [Aureococcus anophagefferens]|nr:hypothetical protein JL720_55 [Aureococcus anophagefferens]
MGGSDDSDDDVPVSRLRGQRGPAALRGVPRFAEADLGASDPSRAEKQPAVDPERDGCPDYLDVIRRPMDLRAIQPGPASGPAKLDAGRRRSRRGRHDAPGSFHAAFVRDMRRVFDNATAYNYDADHARRPAQRAASRRTRRSCTWAKRCLEALEIALGTASDALAAATGAGEARDDAARRAPPQAEAAGRRPAPKKLAVRARLSGAVVAGGDLVAVVQDVRGAFKALPPRGAAAARAPAPPPAGSAEKRPPKVARLRKDATEDERIAAMLAALADYVASCGGDGGRVLATRERGAARRFSATIEVRKEGSTAGTSDIYYYDGGGRRFRSRAEVARLGLAP